MFFLLIAGSMLNNMLSDEDGPYFFNRDGNLFQYIHFYLCTGMLNVQRHGYYKIICRNLLVEATFYQIERMKNELEQLLQPFNDSVILSSDQGQTLMNCLRHTPDFANSVDHLFYRASVHGWASSYFHCHCDNKGPTVTVIKSGNNIFGGFTEQSWDSKF